MGEQTGLAAGDLVTLDADAGEWGRVAGRGRVVETPADGAGTVLVEAEQVRAVIEVRVEEVSPVFSPRFDRAARGRLLALLEGVAPAPQASALLEALLEELRPDLLLSNADVFEPERRGPKRVMLLARLAVLLDIEHDAAAADYMSETLRGLPHVFDWSYTGDLSRPLAAVEVDEETYEEGELLHLTELEPAEAGGELVYVPRA